MKKVLTIAFVFSLFFAKNSYAQHPSTNSPVEFINNNKQPTQSFKVKKLSYEVQNPNVLALLEDNQKNSFLSVGKEADISLFVKEKTRVYKLVSAVNSKIGLKDVYFKVDTTLEKGSCNVVAVVRNTKD